MFRSASSAAAIPVAIPVSAPKPRTTACSISTDARSDRRVTPPAISAAYSCRRLRPAWYRPSTAAPAASTAAAPAVARNSTLASAGPCRCSAARACPVVVTSVIATFAAASLARISGSAPGAVHTCSVASPPVV